MRLRLEALEDRLAPSTFTVANLFDSGTGSLRWAISQANIAGQGIVNFQSGLSGTILLNSELQITSNLRIDASAGTGGTGPHQIAVSASPAGGRDFDILGGVHVAFVGDPAGSQSRPTGFIIENGNNIANGGGIVAFSAQSSLVLIGCDVTNNDVTGSGGGIFTFGSLGLYNSVIESNSALFNGGGVFVGKTFGAYNSLISDNETTGGDGGGVYEFGTGSTMIFANTIVKTNHAVGGAGGGVWARYNLIARGSTFSQNIASRNGGAIFSSDGSVYLGFLTNSSTAATPTIVSSNSAGGDGGGVWADHTVSMAGSSAIGNSALGSGGALFALVGPVYLNAGLVQDNQALGTSKISPALGFGGGIFTSGDVFVVNGSKGGGVPSSSALLGNTSISDGGGIYSLRSVHVSRSFVDGNNSSSGNGGGIFAVLNVLVIDGSVDFNHAVNGFGGGIADQRGNIHVTSIAFDPSGIPPTTGSSVSHNQAIDGGGIWDVEGHVEVNSEILIDHNIANHDGGGIWTGGSLRIDTSTVSNNRAIHGGGIAADGADQVTLFQARILFNRASAPGTDVAAGGGLFVNNVSDLSITYSTIASNKSASGNGAGIALIADPGFPGGANAGIDDSTFGGFSDFNTGLVTPNSAGGFGGAIYVKNVTVDMVHVTFNDNVAFGGMFGGGLGQAGSAIYADIGSAVTLQDTLVDDTNNLANPTLNPGSSELLDSAFAGGLLSAGSNLVHDGSWVNVANWNSVNGDVANGTQDLGPLQFNQAAPPGQIFTETYALVAGSGEQAIGGGDDLGPAVDQNGRPRPYGLPSDIGSVQAF